MKTKQYKTVNNYLDKLDDEQIVTVYDDKHNIHYHGKASYAPLNCYFEFINAIENGNEIIINGLKKEIFTTTSIANVENEEEVKNLFVTAEHYSKKEQCEMYIMSNGETSQVIHSEYKEEFKEEGYWVAAIFVGGYQADI